MPRCSLGSPVRLVFEDVAPGVAVPAFALEAELVSGRMASSNQVAIVGYAQSPKCSGTPTRRSARLTVETARRAIADAGLTVADVDGFVTASLFPSAGAHAAVDGVSLVSANWLAEHLGVNPSYAAGFQGFGQTAGRGRHGGQRRGERRGRLRAGAPGPAQSARRVTTRTR